MDTATSRRRGGHGPHPPRADADSATSPDSAASTPAKRCPARCRRGRTRRSAPPTGSTPSSSPAPRSPRRGTPTAARGCIGCARRWRTARFTPLDAPLLSSAPFDEAARRRTSCAGIRCRFPPAPTDFVDGLVTLGRQRRRGAAVRLRHSPLRRQPLDAASATSTMPTASCCSSRSRVRCGSAPNSARSTSRRARSRSSRAASRFRVELAGRRGARLRRRELRRAASACRSWARSAPTGSPTRATS